MKVAFLTRYGSDRGSSRLRAFDLVPHLARRGVEARVLARRGRDGGVDRLYPLRALALARWADVVVIQKPNQAPRLIDLLRSANRRLAVDLDDALWCPTSPRPTADEREAAGRAEARLCHAMQRARAGFVGSGYLASWVRSRRPDLDVTVLPTSIDLDRYPPAPPAERPRPALVWIGSGDNLGELEALGEVLRALRTEVDFELRVISSRAPVLPGVPVELVPWSPATESAALAGCDAGIMPLHDTERSRGRCGFKAVQYMATGLPVVASGIGAAPEVVEDGVTGLLAHSPQDWLDHLRRLARDPELRRTMGAAGRDRAVRRFSIQSNLPRLVAGLERLLAGGGEVAA